MFPEYKRVTHIILLLFFAVFYCRSISARSELGIPSRVVGNENDEIRYRLRCTSWGRNDFSPSRSAILNRNEILGGTGW